VHIRHDGAVTPKSRERTGPSNVRPTHPAERAYDFGLNHFAGASRLCGGTGSSNRRAFIMKAVGASTLGHLADIGPLCMRAGIGLVFVVHGWQKFHDIKVSNFAKFLDSL